MTTSDRLRAHLSLALANLAVLGAATWLGRDVRAGALRVELPPTATPAPTATAPAVRVYVTGAVARPGLVTLGEGARAADAVAAAGGFGPDADAEGVNLAAPIPDGLHLHVSARGEGGPGPPSADSLLAPAAAPGAVSLGAAAPGGSAGPIDLNSADAPALETLPGIGPALAERIVAHREANGRFASVDGLLTVSGIGERTLERIRSHVTVR